MLASQTVRKHFYTEMPPTTGHKYVGIAVHCDLLTISRSLLNVLMIFTTIVDHVYSAQIKRDLSFH